ncbi:MAG: hypothetical protein KGY38_03175 [Desulfobacterales bacterium]|nr:hypothetical protein [Desulfobacterales bacterium]
MRNLPWLIAHRGAMAEAPENVEAAFDAAFSHEVDGVELDVQMTADNVPVVFHDDTLKRITGKKGSVPDYPFAVLQEFDYGAWHSEAFRGQGIMTLESMLHKYAGRGAMMIELKSGSGIQEPSKYCSRLCREVTRLITFKVPEHLLKEIFILGFDTDMIAEAWQLAPQLKYMLNVKKPLNPEKQNETIHGMLWGYCLPLRKLSRQFCRKCHARDQRIAVYSCNFPDEVSYALNAGADVVMTDDPANTAGAFQKDMIYLAKNDILGKNKHG